MMDNGVYYVMLMALVFMKRRLTLEMLFVSCDL